MKHKILFLLATLLMLASGMRAATPYAVYCSGDKSLHFLTSDTELTAGELLPTGEEISVVYEVSLTAEYVNPAWIDGDAVNATKVVFDESFNSVTPKRCSDWFYNFTALESIVNLKFLDTSEVTSMSYMFFGCSSLTSLDLSNFDNSSLGYMKRMFEGCTSLTSLDLSNFKPTCILDMSFMFANCTSLTTIDLRNCYSDDMVNMQSIFSGCSNLTTIFLTKFITTRIITSTDMFTGCDNLRLLDISQGKVYDFVEVVKEQISRNAVVYLPETTPNTEGLDNIIVGNTCENFVINYGDTPNNQLLLKLPYPFSANTVTINRSFTEGLPYTLYMPFAMDAAAYGTFYTGGELNDTGDTISFSKWEESYTTANTPYMFQPNSDLTSGITIENVEVLATPEDTETDGLNGVYAKRVFTADEEAQKLYYGWAQDSFYYAMEGASVDAGRAYYKLPMTSAAANAPARLKVNLGGEDTTGLIGIESDDQSTDTPVYNLNGQRVGNSYRGIVIKNGQKTVNTAR